MASAGTVTVDFAAETAKFTAQLKQVNARLKNVESGFKTLERVARTALGVFSVGALTAFAKSAAQAADELGKTADKIGISTAGLKTFQVAAGEAGVSLEATNKLLLESQKRLGEAAVGTGEAAKFIKLLGLNVKDLQQLSPDQLFATYSEAITGLSTRSEQLAAASALMGKSSRDAFALIQAGAPAIASAAAFVERFGLALSRVEIQQIEQANDALGRIATVSESAGQRIVAGLAPALEFFANTLLNATGNTRGLQEAAEKFAAVAIVAFEVVANAARSLQAAFFGIAAGAARVFQFLSFGDVSESFAASVDANLSKANEALEKIQSIEQIQQTITTALEDSRARAEAAVAEQAARDAAAKAGGIGLGGDEIGLTQLQNFDIINDAARASAEVQKEIQREITDATLAELERRSQASENIRQIEIQREIFAQQAMNSARASALNASIAALQTFAGQSKKVAIALVLINKAKAIAQAIQNTAVGATLQLTTGDPYTAVARAAAVKAFGAIQVAAIIASGFGEIQQINHAGGAPIGSPSNPINTQPTATDGQQFGATQQPVVQVVISGNVGWTPAIIDELIEGLKDATDNRDVVIFGPNSRQAQEIVVQG